ncbi:hypothetical protein J4Q44_G00188130 [Coregonus suidteri]|uniref:Uncharacterized protein n=1 Tax=Coregonus suidteri TaxID=861788 RepID=A0AAN8QTZ2_9TELE
MTAASNPSGNSIADRCQAAITPRLLNESPCLSSLTRGDGDLSPGLLPALRADLSHSSSVRSRLEAEPGYCTNHSRHSTRRKQSVCVASHWNTIPQVGFRWLQGGRGGGESSVSHYRVEECEGRLQIPRTSVLSL